MALTEEQIELNRKRFLDLIDSITVEDGDKEGLKTWLVEKSDFFEAPASTKYHASYKGGLCDHSLNVYDNLIKIVDTFACENDVEETIDPKTQEVIFAKQIKKRLFSDDSLKIVALLHDISKANFYEKYNRNVKDENGKWVQVEEYKVRDAGNKFVYGNHEQNSEFMVHTFFPLTLEESAAILHHHAGMSKDSYTESDIISSILTAYPLSLFLHMADLTAAYYIEK